MNQLSEYFIFFFESVAFFMAIFFFIQFSILKKLEYLWYAIYLLLLSVYYPLAIPELFFGVSLDDKKVIAGYDLFKRPVQFLVSVFYSLFVIHYLTLKKRSRPLYTLFYYLQILYIVLALGCFAGNFFAVAYDPLYYVVGLLLFPLQLYVLTALFKYKVPYSFYIIWGSITLLVGSIITLLLSLYLNKNPAGPINNANSYIPVMISVLLDIFLFTVALQRKIADNEKSLIDAAYSRQQAVMLERERIIADLHDDVGGGLSSIRMMSDLMAQQGKNTNGESVNFSYKISATAKDIAQRMNTIIWSLNTENDSLQNFTEYVRNFGISYFETSPIKFQSTASENLPSNTELSGVQRKNLFLIIKEALHNILKHSGGSQASVHMKMNNGILSIEVIDNGTGIQNPNNFGNGLKNMKKRMGEINGTLIVTSDNGTHIILTLAIL
jgi:signal transduction histidine kinase